MPHTAFTPAWADALRAAITADPDYRAAAANWTWPVALVADAAPERGLPEPVGVHLDLHRGECRSAAIVPGEDAAAEFVLRGDLATWEDVVAGELDPMSAIMRQRLRLTRGSMTRLALHAASALALARAAGRVDTEWPGQGASSEEVVTPETAAPDVPAPDVSAPEPTGVGVAGSADDANGVETAGESSAGESSELDGSAYRRLFHNAGRLGWDPEAVDLTRDVEDWARIRREHGAERYAEQIHRLCSLFFEGEQSVTETLAPFLGAIPRAGLPLDMELHLAAQVFEEARHFAFFDRYFREVLGDLDTDRHLASAPRAVLVDDLDDVAQRIRREEDPSRLRTLLVEGVTHYMGIVEAMLARTGYRGAGEALSGRGWLPGLQEGFRLIRRDEGRHVAFGIHFIGDMTAADPTHRDTVLATFERHLPNVMDTVGAFYEFEDPIVDVAALQEYALGAYRQFMAAAGLEEGAAGELAAEVQGA